MYILNPVYTESQLLLIYIYYTKASPLRLCQNSTSLFLRNPGAATSTCGPMGGNRSRVSSSQAAFEHTWIPGRQEPQGIKSVSGSSQAQREILGGAEMYLVTARVVGGQKELDLNQEAVILHEECCSSVALQFCSYIQTLIRLNYSQET